MGWSNLMRALVIGGARSGSGVALLLRKEGYEVTLVSRDDFEMRGELEEKGIKVVLNDAYDPRYEGVDLVVKNPGIPNSHSLVKHFPNFTNEVEIAAKYNSLGKYYAISGSNGKTSTVNLLYEMLQRKDETALLAGNVGISLSQKLYESGNIAQNVALELSSFQIENLFEFKPEVYALLNLSPDHLDRYESEEAYYQTKVRLINQAKIFIRNLDDENIVRLTQDMKVNTLDLSLEKQADIYIKDGQAFFQDVVLFEVELLHLKMKHHLYNALFAASMAYLAGVDVLDIQAVLREFKGVEHRLEYVGRKNDVLFYNDSKATNPNSTQIALTSFDKPVILLAGGKDEGISFAPLKEYEKYTKAVYLFGESKDKLKEVFTQATLVEDLNEAFSLATQLAEKEDIILLSPACASYDQFKNFEKRGELFKSLVLDQ